VTLSLDEGLIMLGFILIIVGIAVLFIGFLHMAFSGVEKKQGKVEAGGVVMIGPIPIAFGTSSKALLYSMILAVVLIVLSIFLILYTQRALIPH
jgi:uncharacterized protein (TIGR00304 family)